MQCSMQAEPVKTAGVKPSLCLCLQAAELPKKLQDQFEEFHRFNTTRFFGQQADPIAACTSDKYADHARSIITMFTFAHHVTCHQFLQYYTD